MAVRSAALVLAAGLSRRMGGPNKLLLPHRGRPLVIWALEAACGSRAERVVVVTGRDGDEVAAALPRHPKIVRAHNETPEAGLAQSLRCGLARTGGFEAVAVLLGDMPYIRAPLVDALIAAVGPTTYASYPCYRGERGNPVALGRRAMEDCRSLTGDIGAGALLDAHAHECARLDVDDAGTRLDFDAPVAFLCANPLG